MIKKKKYQNYPDWGWGDFSTYREKYQLENDKMA